MNSYRQNTRANSTQLIISVFSVSSYFVEGDFFLSLTMTFVLATQLLEHDAFFTIPTKGEGGGELGM